MASREASLYALCWLRSAHRILELVASTDDNDNDDFIDTIRTREDIHTFIQQSIDVKNLLGDGGGGLLTISVKAIMNNPRSLPKELSHSHFSALEIKNALCDVVRELRGDRPTVDVDDPDVPLVAIFRGIVDNNNGYNNNNRPPFRGGAGQNNGRAAPVTNGASLSLYRSLHPPGSLHKRGYRTGSAIHKAAMKESLAAGLLIEAGWQDQVDQIVQNPESTSKLCLVDPMAGSGSLIIEACMMATDIAPGLMRIRCGLDSHRIPPVTRWKKSSVEDDGDDDDATLWKKILLDATNRAKVGIQRMREYQQEDASRKIRIEANDIHTGAVDIMEEALSSAGLLDFVEISNMDCYDLDVKHDDDTTYVVATNPPWGVRLTEDIEESWEGLKHFIRNKCPEETQVFILSGDKAATATLKLKRDRMIPLQTGEQNLRWIQYTIRGKKVDEENELDSKPSQTSQTRVYNSSSPSNSNNCCLCV